MCGVLCFQIKQSQDDEKKQLMDLRDLIKSATQLDQREVQLLTLNSDLEE